MLAWRTDLDPCHANKVPLMNYAILAPVPIMHLESAKEVAGKVGYVSFGSDQWEFFRELDGIRNGQDVPVVIYASSDRQSGGQTVTWQGWYVGSTDSALEMSADRRNGHRPESTGTDGAFGVYWRVRDLRPIAGEDQTAISSLVSLATGQQRAQAAPRGPQLIERPPHI